MIVDVQESSVANDAMLSKLRQFLSTSINDGYTRHRICKSLKQSQMTLYTILTAKSFFDRTKKYLPNHIGNMEEKALSDVDRFMVERRRKDLERIANNEYLLFIGCIIIASKLYMDFTYTNFSWIEVCHYAVDHINAAERQVLQILDYDVGLNWAELKKMYDEFGETPNEFILNQIDIKPRSGFFKWAFGSLFRFISCAKV